VVAIWFAAKGSDHDGLIPNTRERGQDQKARELRVGLDSQRSAVRWTFGRRGQVLHVKGANEIQTRSVDASQTAKLRGHGTKRKQRIWNSYVVPVYTALVAGRRMSRSRWRVASRRMRMKRNRLRRRKRQRLPARQRSGQCDQQQPRDPAPRSRHAFMSR